MNRQTTDDAADVVNYIAGNTYNNSIRSNQYIRDSWKRCRDVYNIERDKSAKSVILTASEILEHQQSIEEFLNIAKAGVQKLAARLNDTGYAVILADASGTALDVKKPNSTAEEFTQAGVLLGAQWDEKIAGTSGIGTALVLQSPLSVHRDEHYLHDNSKLSCSVCPIFDSSGSLLACFNVSSLNVDGSKEAEMMTLQLVTMFARMVENTYFNHRHKKHYILNLALNIEFYDKISDCLVAIDEEGNIVGANRAAVAELGEVPGGMLVTKNIRNVLPLTMNQIVQASKEDEKIKIHTSDAEQTLYIKVQSPRINNRISKISVVSKPDNLDNRHPGLDQLCGEDVRVTQSVCRVLRIIDKDIPVLITGETGTGKEAFARAIHNASLRSSNPFVAMNCAAIPESLIESELFGYRGGSFTGALKKGMRGKLVQANGGTLFLDEIGDMPRNLQTRLLRVLAEKEVTPIGGEDPIRLDIQLISATHQDLMDMILNQEFREDLYYRLNGMLLELPALRERTDKEALIRHIFSIENSGEEVTISTRAMTVLVNYQWPGNIRELQNVLRYALAVCNGNIIDEPCLSPHIRENYRHQKDVHPVEERPTMTDPDFLLDCLKRNKWNITQVATELDVARSTVYRKMKKYKIVLPNEQCS